MPIKRKSLSKKIRFEVFKRDAFKCQYCGAEAPGAILHVDHIKPVAAGGTDDLHNLITSCQACNLGKGATALDDRTVAAKSRLQLEELQNRREQLELMLQWRESMADITSDAVARIASYFEKQSSSGCITPEHKQTIKKWLRKFKADEVLDAIEIAANQYLSFDSAGELDPLSIEQTFTKVPKICQVKRASAVDPDLEKLFYIRGILRKRISGYFNEPIALNSLKTARSQGVSVEVLTNIATTANNWSNFLKDVDSAVELQLRPSPPIDTTTNLAVDVAMAKLRRCIEQPAPVHAPVRLSPSFGLRNALISVTPFDQGPFGFDDVHYLNSDSALKPCLPAGTPPTLYAERQVPEAVMLALRVRNLPWDSTRPAWFQVLSLRPDLIQYASILRSHRDRKPDERRVLLSAETCRYQLKRGFSGLRPPTEDTIFQAIHTLAVESGNILGKCFYIPSRALTVEMAAAAQALARAHRRLLASAPED